MNRVEMYRTYLPDVTISSLKAYKKNKLLLMANTIELPYKANKRRISCIPEGVFDCVPHDSPHLGKTFLVRNVINRDNILIHIANFAAGKKIDLLGCIGAASYIKDINSDTYLDGVHSGEIMKILLHMFPKGFTLIIKESSDN